MQNKVLRHFSSHRFARRLGRGTSCDNWGCSRGTHQLGSPSLSAGDGAGAVAPGALRKRQPWPFPRAGDLWRVLLHIPACPSPSHATEESSMLGAVVWPSPLARHWSPLQSPSPRQPLAGLLFLASGNSTAPQIPSPAGTPGMPGPQLFWQTQSLSKGGAGSSSAREWHGLLPALCRRQCRQGTARGSCGAQGWDVQVGGLQRPAAHPGASGAA